MRLPNSEEIEAEFMKIFRLNYLNAFALLQDLRLSSLKKDAD
ncbi:MAG: hypothetical protein RIQ70_1778 [Bacteroidota bacterium]|jgi:hypothetical protein